jgi:hypothetical protein
MTQNVMLPHGMPPQQPPCRLCNTQPLQIVHVVRAPHGRVHKIFKSVLLAQLADVARNCCIATQ